MYREPSEEHIKGRVAWHAGGQVITGGIFIVGGAIAFVLTWSWLALLFVGSGAFCVLYWGPVWKKFKEKSKDHHADDFFPGGKL